MSGKNNCIEKISYYLLQLFSHFRMSRKTFSKLVEMFRQDGQMVVCYTGGHEVIPIEKKVPKNYLILVYLSCEYALNS